MKLLKILIATIVMISLLITIGCIETEENMNLEGQREQDIIHDMMNPEHEEQDELELAGIENYPQAMAGLLLSTELMTFFESFDEDMSFNISITEAETFYYWIENNIQYRYDDENEQDPAPGSLVGDGREGDEYWQTPEETYVERAGDCEDTAILYLAFLNFWNISSYLAIVDVDADGIVDHAVTLFYAGDNIDEYTEYLGTVDYYVIDGHNYVMVDNAYSDKFGYISTEITKNQFDIYGTWTLYDILKDRLNYTAIDD